MVCIQCGKELPKNFTTNICLECSKENVRKIFKEYPEIKDAFRESIEEMKKPENMKKMVDDTARFIGAIQSMQKR
ncbi:MAG: hypothetical protein KHW88_03645 [Lachnospiraceae bacterium]|nr:hypothetical protein [Lachnospiraceae bacterium]